MRRDFLGLQYARAGTVSFFLSLRYWLYEQFMFQSVPLGQKAGIGSNQRLLYKKGLYKNIIIWTFGLLEEEKDKLSIGGK